MTWIDCFKEPMPRGERFILVKHKYGIDYIYFGSGCWRFCYSAAVVDDVMIQNITHWIDPKTI